jgi:APA family basic amino acid/polyamine antiporter
MVEAMSASETPDSMDIRQAESDSRRPGEIGLVRQLGMWDTSAIIVGTIIGSGIFLMPGLVARNVGSPGLILITWILGGILSLMGALIFAELASFLPHTGGIYVFLKDAFGSLTSFVFGWLFVLAIKPAAIATITIGMATYLRELVPLTDFGVNVAAIALIIVLSTIHYRGVRLGSGVQNFLTGLKVLLILGFIVLGLTSGHADWSRLSAGTGGGLSLGMLTNIGVALALVLWAYDGWADISYMAGEVSDPGRTLPRAIVAGTVVVIAIYLLMNVVFLVTVPLEQMMASDRVAADSARTLLRAGGAIFVSVAIVISITGAANGSVMLGPRVYYRMGADGYFFKWMGQVHPRFRTPGNAVIAQGIWASVLAISGTFEQLSNLFIFTTWLFFILSTVALFVFRKRYPDRERPYTTWGYPWVPALFLVIGVSMLLNSLVQRPLESGVGLGFAALGLPAYYLIFKRRIMSTSGGNPDESD